MKNSQIQTDILILGAGIGGYETFRSLVKELAGSGLKKSLLLVDQNDYFTFKPLLHEVVSGSVEPRHATIALSDLASNYSLHAFTQATVKKIHPLKKMVETDQGTVAYEYCVVALGSAVNYLGIPGAAEYSYNVNSLESALCLREELMREISTPNGMVHITIVGGGYTGVEVAGQLAQLAWHGFAREYPNKNFAVSIVERDATIAATLPPKAQRQAMRRLSKLGVQCYFGKAVKEVKRGAIVLEDGEQLPSSITIWAAGIKNIAPELLSMDHFEKGCIPVNDYLHCAACPSLYAIGDIAFFCPPGMLRPAPQLGEAAYREGAYVARHLVATLRGKKIEPFRFKSKGTVMPIGERYGLVVLGNRLVFSGLIAWWFRRFIYVLFMPGLKRKLKLMLDWGLPPFNIIDIIKGRKK